MNLSDYVDVPTRFAALLAKWPELRIKEHRPEIITVGDQIFISVTMQAWRTPDDPLPCQATCYEPFPGRTPKSFASDKPSEAQLRLLKALGHTDTPPATKREASALIEALKEAQVNANGEAF